MVLCKGQRTVQGPWLFLLWAFFPNWPWLLTQNTADHGSSWQLVEPGLPRQAWHLWHNPSVSMALLHQNLIKHLATDIHNLAENTDIRDSVSYQLVTRMAWNAYQDARWGDTPVVHRPDGFAPKAFQFEVRWLRLGQPSDAHMLLSPVVHKSPKV